MAPPSRAGLLQGLASGAVPPRDLAGLTVADCAELSARADEALSRGAAKDAALLLETLSLLEPSAGEHLLRQAEALAPLGERERALELLDRYVELELPRPPDRLVAALRLRAELRPAQAEEDLLAASLLEQQGAGGGR